MVLKSEGYNVRDYQLWCWTVTVMVCESNVMINGCSLENSVPVCE
jgi:hypothetical protein